MPNSEVHTDFSRPESVVEVLIDGEWEATPFQASQFYTHGAPDQERMVREVNRWLADVPHWIKRRPRRGAVPRIPPLDDQS